MRWYDQRSVSCDGCLRLRLGAFPDGTPYEACRWYGYILHDELGVSDEPCSYRETDAERAEAPRPKSIRQMGGRR